jgi:hypothetical protein
LSFLLREGFGGHVVFRVVEPSDRSNYTAAAPRLGWVLGRGVKPYEFREEKPWFGRYRGSKRQAAKAAQVGSIAWLCGLAFALFAPLRLRANRWPLRRLGFAKRGRYEKTLARLSHAQGRGVKPFYTISSSSSLGCSALSALGS